MPRRVSRSQIGRFLFLSLVTGAVVARGAADEDDLARELPRIPPTPVEEAQKTFKVHEGFHLRPIATEPEVTDPVHAVFDADGALYVVEMRGYPYPEKVPTGNVRRLVDRDGDGTYETSTIFVDGLSWPTSVVPYDGGVFIAVPPEILYAKDTDGDGVADVRKVMFRGFGTQNVQALVNGLLWGPDGWIYGASGGNGGDIVNLTRPDDPPVSVRGRDFRFKPDGSAFEVTSGGGQFGHAFDDWGHRFVCNNSNHIRQIVLPARELDRNPALVGPSAVLDIAAEGAAAPVFRTSTAEPWRIVRTRQRAADPEYRKRLPPTELVATGFFTSATGVTIYRGTAFPPEYRGNAFIGDVGGNLIHRKLMSRDGVTFLATRADQGVEFITSTDNWFRPVNFTNTPDGTLLVLDMYRETIEHPASIPEPIKKHLDLTSGHDRGRLYALEPVGFRRHRSPSLSKATTDMLVALLADPDAWWRETAQRLLIERNSPAALPALRALAEGRPNALGRLHALWTLDALGASDANLVLNGLADPEPGVREASAKLAMPLAASHPELAAGLVKLADDPEPMVRFQAAFALGAVPGPEAVAALAKIAAQAPGDRLVRAAVLSSVAGRTTALLDALAATEGFLASDLGRSWLDELAALVGAENRPEEIRTLLERFAGGESADLSTARSVLLGLGRGLQRSGGSLRSALDGPTAERIAPLFDRAASTAADPEAAEPARVDAVRLLGLGEVDRALEALPPLLDAREPGSVQLAALQALAALPGPKVGPAVIGRWTALSPSIRREAAEALFARPERINALLDAIESKAIAANDLDPARRVALLAHPDAAVKARAEALLGRTTASDRAAVLSAFRPALELTGSPDKGRAVFRQACATCHRVEGVGVDVGPNLATVVGRTPEDLLNHILDPNREIAPPYVNYTVATTDGLVLTGVIAEETAAAVTLKRAEGASDIVPRPRIEAIRSTGLSLMPEGLEKGLEPQGMADLIAYVRAIQAGGQTGGR